MRNDAHDELDHVPSLRADQRDHDDYATDHSEPARGNTYGRAAAAAPVKAASTGPLWALVGALMIALGGLGWWSFQQISLMEQQLVATQESFARISEEAAGRIQDISGKVVATESSVTSGSEALKLQVKQLESKLAELSKQQQGAVSQQSEQSKRLEQLALQLKGQEGGGEKLEAILNKLSAEQAVLKNEQATLKSTLAGQSKLDEKLAGLSGEIDALKKQGNPNQAIARVEQDLLVLKSDLETRSAGSSTAEFDAFRAQMTRNISTLQAQVQNLQQQIDAR
ncbi:MAG: ATPase [Pseudomonas sp.]|uniref:ATPase n=1 Tax=Pseudomonas sp. TaxID=306 RepID=UPI002716C0BC|nr:ATPase [Pseudomonas sp.]MDO9616253.1 ATPase [Pseudomonas sp.]MDP2447826.1 ATPase [Pseudomonas sp.]MDZ4336602.1 ATPase [Pseudomonas sp.]